MPPCPTFLIDLLDGAHHANSEPAFPVSGDMKATAAARSNDRLVSKNTIPKHRGHPALRQHTLPYPPAPPFPLSILCRLFPLASIVPLILLLPPAFSPNRQIARPHLVASATFRPLRCSARRSLAVTTVTCAGLQGQNTDGGRFGRAPSHMITGEGG